MKRIDTNTVQNFELEHQKTLRALAPDCMLFLRRTEDFPLEVPGKVALFGSGARKTIKGGTGSGDVNVRSFVTIEQGLENAGFTVTSKAWMDAYDDLKATAQTEFYAKLRKEAEALGVSPFMYGFGAVLPEPDYDFPITGEGETAVYVLARNSGEGNDRTNDEGDFRLTPAEKRDILAVAAAYKKFLLVLNVGGPVDLSELPTVKNILLLSQLGTVTGDAFADVLLGKANPSGKLTTTWAAADAYQTIGNFADRDDTYYREGIYVGYRYFDSTDTTPVFPFGFGLSYTTFTNECTAVTLDNGELHVSAKVTNTGKFAGRETLQLYYSAPSTKLDHPYQELGAFKKTSVLAPGAEETLALTLPLENMASFDEATASWYLEAGAWALRLGSSSRETSIIASLVFDREITVEQRSHVCGSPAFTDWKPETASVLPSADRVIEVHASDLHLPGLYERNRLPRIDRRASLSAVDLSAFSDRELAEVCCGNGAANTDPMSFIRNAGSTVAGTAAESASVITKKGYGSMILADGPAGLRLSPEYLLSDDGLAVSTSNPLQQLFFNMMSDEEKAYAAQQAATEAEKNKDRVHYYQYCSAIPIGTALAQTWDPELVAACGEIVGNEMKLFGVNVWLAPALNIHRSVLCGRNFEYYSEDPLISGKMAASMTLGVQKKAGNAVTIKHFACNNQELNRMYNNSHLSERALREIYLKGFEICVKEAQPLFIMTSYNLINGIHAANNKDLLTTVLREEWGFDGVVMTDWTTTTGMVSGSAAQKYGNSDPAACISSGNDLIEPGAPSDIEGILSSLNGENSKSPLSRAELEACARRVLAMSKELTANE